MTVRCTTVRYDVRPMTVPYGTTMTRCRCVRQVRCDGRDGTRARTTGVRMYDDDDDERDVCMSGRRFTVSTEAMMYVR